MLEASEGSPGLGNQDGFFAQEAGADGCNSRKLLGYLLPHGISI